MATLHKIELNSISTAVPNSTPKANSHKPACLKAMSGDAQIINLKKSKIGKNR
jgi:hypothetical protein